VGSEEVRRVGKEEEKRRSKHLPHLLLLLLLLLLKSKYIPPESEFLNYNMKKVLVLVAAFPPLL